MAKRLARRVAVALPVAGALMLGIGATPAAAENPHASGDTGNPHAEGARGNPHVSPAGSTTADTSSGTSTDTSSSSSNSSSSNSSSSPSSGSSAATVSSSSPVTAAAAPRSGGGGAGGGKPADGSVGNANHKKPTHTKDNGYECNSRNNGVGKGNPAHSGCPNTTTTTTTPTTTTPTTTTSSTTPDGPTTSVLGETITRPAKVLGVTVTRGGTLAATGSTPLGDTVDLTFLALGLVGLGAMLRRLAARG